ncbi:hypothetical protein HPB50_009637 [Hyalomma asiaticum]|uniref:Uncharacterized protein n=1 Tax=Hyalomma asiaticum TaxID=266040 RepID=A0ACB7T6N2_HYAAI|nr:hypothetical protein HPB50_009637 [Hyalomma asiaticum]
MTSGQRTDIVDNSGVLVHLPKFSPEKDDLEVYVQSFEVTISVNKLDKATKKQSKLTAISINDRFLVKGSSELTDAFRGGIPAVSSGFSVDIEELYYSVPHHELLPVVRDFLEDSGAAQSQVLSPFSVDSFLELLAHYLDSTMTREECSGFKTSQAVREDCNHARHQQSKPQQQQQDPQVKALGSCCVKEPSATPSNPSGDNVSSEASGSDTRQPAEGPIRSHSAGSARVELEKRSWWLKHP